MPIICFRQYTMRALVLVLLFLLSFLTDLTASVEVRSTRLTTTDGLSNNSIRYIFQDSKGFIWLGTLNGLSRYDGNSFVNFYPETGNGISLADSRIRDIQEDSNGFLWISTTSSQQSCYDLKKGAFVDFTGCGEYKQNYNMMMMASNGDIWLWHDANGCRRVRYKDGAFSSTVFKVEQGNMPSNVVNFVFEDEQKDIWIGTNKGMVLVAKGTSEIVDRQTAFYTAVSYKGYTCFLTKDNQIYQKTAEGKIRKVASLPLLSEAMTPTGTMRIQDNWYVFTSEGGFKFKLDTRQVSRAGELDIKEATVFNDNRQNFWIYNQTGNVWYVRADNGAVKRFNLLPSEKIGYIDTERYHVVHDSRDIIWISTYGNGLFVYNAVTGEMDHFTSQIDGFSHIGSDFLQYVVEDRSGGIWVSAEYSGISRLEVINKGAYRIFPEDEHLSDRSNAFRVISPLRNGNLLFTTRKGGVYEYRPNLTFTGNKKSYKSNIYSLKEDNRGVMWMGSRGDGLCIGDRWYRNDLSKPNSLGNNNIFNIYQDNKGRMWIATFGGGLDLAIPGNDGYTFRHFLNDTYVQRQTRVIVEDRNGMLWVGTSGGVYIFNPDSLISNPENYVSCGFKTGHLLNDEVRCLLRDTRGRMWVGTSGGGFSMCDPGRDYANLTFEHYSVKDGLVNNMVQSIAEDRNGKLWIATEYGLSCFNTKDKLFENHFLSSYALGNVYSENCFYTLDNGKLLFGTNYGLAIIDPEQVVNLGGSFPVTFTNLSINGIAVRPDDPDSPLGSEMPYTDKVELKYFQNSIVIDFSTFDYSNSSEVKYSYRLSNYDKEWSSPSSLNFAAYKNLSPGTYVLYVKSCNSVGAWSKEEATMEFVIYAPYWKTGWAFLLYAVVLIVLLYFGFNIMRNFNGLRNRIQIERQLTEYKLVFFTNISHEFRTPLTLIQGALEKIQRTNNVPKEIQHSLKTMDKSTKRLLRLINQLLEFRKMQNNKLALSLEETDVIAFLYEIFLSFKDASESKNMNFSFQPSVAAYRMFIDKGYIDKVTYNLLSNAFKYTPSGGKITFVVVVDEEKNTLSIEVADSGVGIPKEKQPELFNRFMQSSFSGSSVGVGLHLTYELVNVHKGHISYHENEGGGSVFVVALPLDKSVYADKDFLIPDNVLMKEEGQPKESFIQGHEEEWEQPIPLNKRKILIIEDDNDVREFLKEEISKYFEVTAESDGDSGLERAREYDPDLIVCDVMMPGINGFEVTQKMKSDFNTSHIPIILLTALGTTESQLEGIESGADAYITKPFSPALLMARICKLIEQRDKLREKFSNEPGVLRPAVYSNDRDKEFVNKLHEVLEKRLSDPQFTVDEFASMMKLGRTVFYKKVRGLTGYSPNEYLRIVRMKKAAELLLDSNLTVAEVSYRVGINDPFYFSKCFKTQFGMAPSIYQRGEKDVEI